MVGTIIEVHEIEYGIIVKSTLMACGELVEVKVYLQQIHMLIEVS